MESKHQGVLGVVPSVVLDTNVLHAIYSWHDILIATQAVHETDPAATLEHSKIQFRAQRARTAFILTLLFNERGMSTLVPLNEFGRTLMERAPPEGAEHGARSNFVRLYLYFIKDHLLPSWSSSADLAADAEKKGNDVDLLCIDWAEEHKIPLISWEGHGPDGFDPSKLIPLESARRGIDLVTPEQFIFREVFDQSAAIQRFANDWNRLAPDYLAKSPDARETLSYAASFYSRMSKNDWTP
jgi:hypothetical protein